MKKSKVVVYWPFAVGLLFGLIGWIYAYFLWSWWSLLSILAGHIVGTFIANSIRLYQIKKHGGMDRYIQYLDDLDSKDRPPKPTRKELLTPNPDEEIILQQLKQEGLGQLELDFLLRIARANKTSITEARSSPVFLEILNKSKHNKKRTPS